MIRAAIIGLGRWGRSLVNSVQGKSDAIRFTRAYTRTRASAEDFCREKNMPLAASYEEILADPQIDAVVLATPHSQHEAQVRQAAAAGKHIHVEKPITLDYAQRAGGRRRRAEGRRRAGGRVYCRRFHPIGRRDAATPRRRPARHGCCRMVAQHTTSTGAVHPAGQLARRARRRRRAAH